tara:strand:+ start:2397 stop:2789 length:393 start_codon:yes stop_codon:yes gene_type:complete
MLTHLLFAAAIILTASPADETIRSYGGGAGTWQVVEMNGTPFTGTATLSFPKAGQIAGQAPCNRYVAEMIVPYPWFEVGPIAATRMACPELDQEAVFFKALEAATLSEVQGGLLILSDDAGDVLVFKPAE